MSVAKLQMSEPVTVVGVVFAQFELLDLFGPYELFGMLQERVRIVTAAQAPGIVASNQGPRVVADVGMDDVERADVVVVPGGWGTRREMKNAAFLGSLVHLASRTQIVTSVCTGSMLLANAGLLDGRRATSNKRVFDQVAALNDRVQWIRRARWVEDGNIFTSSGVSAGMDMTLAVIARLFDRATAENAARLAEYTWHRDADVDPFAIPGQVQE